MNKDEEIKLLEKEIGHLRKVIRWRDEYIASFFDSMHEASRYVYGTVKEKREEYLNREIK